MVLFFWSPVFIQRYNNTYYDRKKIPPTIVPELRYFGHVRVWQWVPIEVFFYSSFLFILILSIFESNKRKNYTFDLDGANYYAKVDFMVIIGL